MDEDRTRCVAEPTTPLPACLYSGDSWPDRGSAGRRVVGSVEDGCTVQLIPGGAEVMSEIIAGVEIPETAAVAEATRLIQGLPEHTR